MKKSLIALICVLAMLLTACSGTGQGRNMRPKQHWNNNILRSDEIPKNEDGYYDNTVVYSVFGSEYLREQIRSVTFLDTLKDAPADAWDVSEAGNGKILAWVTPNGDLYDLYIGAEGGVSAGESCVDLFACYANVEQFYNLEFLYTGNVQNMSAMFSGCQLLTSLDLSSFDTSSVLDMGGMFNCCSSLTNLDLSSFDTAKVENMRYMFNVCISLTNLDLSSFDTSSVLDMSSMFENCRSLTDLDLSSFDTSNVQMMGCMFLFCTSLTGLDLANFDTSNVQYMNGMFGYCELLTDLDLSSFDTANVKDTTSMFYDCPAGADWQHLLN